MTDTRVPRLFRLVIRLLVIGVIVTGLQVVISAGSASADPSPTDWQRLRTCESGGNYSIVSANGHYYGAYQFDLATWASVGGTGLPSQASPAEQDYRALYLYRMRGWQPWTCARVLGLRPDGDAASGVVPPEPASFG
jgi:resuscitation-promoting factor RpfA